MSSLVYGQIIYTYLFLSSQGQNAEVVAIPLLVDHDIFGYAGFIMQNMYANNT